MENQTLPLAAEFDNVCYETWLKLVKKQLGSDNPLDKLNSHTDDNIAIEVLYDRLEHDVSSPGQFPYTRSCNHNPKAWEICQVYSQSSPAKNNTHIIEDLNKGVTQLRLEGDALTQPSQFEALLNDVTLDWVSVEFDCGISYTDVSENYWHYLKQNNTKLDEMKLAYNADPAAYFTKQGSLPSDSNTHLEQLAELAKQCIIYPNMKAVGVVGSTYHNAGASSAQEIGIMLATGITYLRAMTAAGIDINDACQQIRFRITCDTDFFQNIVKLRVLRELWAKVCQHCGASDAACKIDLSAETSTRMLSQRDPWVNCLRNTLAISSAGIGGANAISSHNFDSPINQQTSLGRRINRNTHLLLQEESSLHKTIDPMGGSYFIESQTQALSQKAWEILQAIEQQGDIFKALENGSLQKQIIDVQEKRQQAIRKRKKPIIGVSEFADINEPAPKKESLEKTQNNSSALTAIRLSSEFESLRDASDQFTQRHNQKPTITTITLGKLTDYNLRLQFAKNLYAAGGIELSTLNCTTEDDIDHACQEVNKSKTSHIIICSSDALYEQFADTLTKALRLQGISHITMTGKHSLDHIDTTLYLGCDVIKTLQNAHKNLGVSL